MNTLESITVSLKKARELKEAGYPQRISIFHWWKRIGHEEYEELGMNIMLDGGSPYIAAPTAEEILRRLPTMIEYQGGTFLLFIFPHWADAPKWMMGYERSIESAQKTGSTLWIHGKGAYHATGDTLANAAAAMWIYLKKNNLLLHEPTPN